MACRTIAKDLAFGAGSYAVPSAGTASFGFAVALAPHSPSTYLGQLNVITPGKWWFEGNVTSYGKTGVTCNATANAASKTTFASFGFDIAYTPTSGQPALPSTSPIALSSGGIFIT